MRSIDDECFEIKSLRETQAWLLLVALDFVVARPFELAGFCFYVRLHETTTVNLADFGTKSGQPKRFEVAMEPALVQKVTESA